MLSGRDFSVFLLDCYRNTKTPALIIESENVTLHLSLQNKKALLFLFSLFITSGKNWMQAAHLICFLLIT